ncbi:MAG: hypothetical protein B6D56_06495 [Candidatus Omnitrophica bacterium 4484_70.1]|nr:MAG: hypothetical protein B6D56_06495 [Candidatus Omnitrophica bacterium 4484_70.1]
MPHFRYIVKNKEGKTIKGIEEATSRMEVIKKLTAKDFFIVSVKEIAEEKKKTFLFLGKKRWGLKYVDLVFLARNLSIALSAGLPLVRSLEILAHQAESVKLSGILEKLTGQIKRGLSLHEAIATFPQVFSPLWCGMIETGETSGNLIFALEKLADYLELRLDFERKIKSFLIYPTILLIVAFVVVTVFFKMILPRFASLFEQFGITLPLPTRILFGISNFFNHYFGIVVLAFLGICVFFMWSRKKRWMRVFWDRISINLPLFKKITHLLYLERFTSLMHILLESGVPIVYTLEIVSRSIGNVVFQNEISSVKEKVKGGKALSSELARFSVFPILVSEIIHIGEEAGNLPQMFEQLSQHYRKELSTRIERLVYILEPLMIVIMAAIIGGIVISLFLPLFKLSTLGA